MAAYEESGSLGPRGTMPKQILRHPSVPTFDSDLLDRIDLAVGHRARAWKHRVRDLDCSRERDGDDERLNIDLRAGVQVRLSVWPDGGMFLGVHEAGSRRSGGWVFSFTGHGDVSAVPAATVVAHLEQTLALAHPATRPADAVERILALWREAGLSPRGR